MKSITLNIKGADFTLYKDDLSLIAYASLLACSEPGRDATLAVQRFIDSNPVTVTVSDARDYLRGYGAWDDTELCDHTANVERLVWLLAGDMREHGEAHLSTY